MPLYHRQLLLATGQLSTPLGPAGCCSALHMPAWGTIDCFGALTVF